MAEVYMAGDPIVRVDEEFAKLLPTLSDEEFVALERDIMVRGCTDPLTVWDDGNGNGDGYLLLDGHHRFKICTKLGIPFKVQKYTVPNTRREAMEWMVEYQLGRRNLHPSQRIKLAEEFREKFEIEANARKTHKVEAVDADVPTKPEAKGKVVEKIGALAGVGPQQVTRYRHLEKHATPEELASLDAGETTINKLYRKYKPVVEKESAPAWKPEDPEAAMLGSPDESHLAESEETDDQFLASLPLGGILEGRQHKIFTQDALDYRYFEQLRKKIADVARNRFKSGGGKGPWAYLLMRFLKCEHPKYWVICPAPENGGCNGTGAYEFGECPRCHGAGYLIKGTYVNGSNR